MIRLGRISYVNMAPVFYRLGAEVEEVSGVPTDLNGELLAGDLDLAPDLLHRVRAPRRSSAHPAASLRLLGRGGRLDPARVADAARARPAVAITPESATSVVLTRVLLPEAEHVPLGEDAEAKLLIGDAALKSAFEDPTPHHDLGRLWLERTGPADGVRRLGRARAGRGGARGARGCARRIRAEGARRARASRARGERSDTGIPPASSHATSRSCATPSARGSVPAWSASSSWRREAGELDRVPELRFARDEVPV